MTSTESNTKDKILFETFANGLKYPHSPFWGEVISRRLNPSNNVRVPMKFWKSLGIIR